MQKKLTSKERKDIQNLAKKEAKVVKETHSQVAKEHEKAIEIYKKKLEEEKRNKAKMEHTV